MIKNFTEDDILMYLYGELPSDLHEEYLMALTIDFDFANLHQEMASAVQLLNNLLIEPPKASLEKVIDLLR